MGGEWSDIAKAGYRAARPVERSGFGMSVGVASTVAISRLINHVLERRRPAPVLRSVARRVSGVPKDDSSRVHHFVPGLALVLATGGAGIATRDDNVGPLLSVPFGVGLGLVLDELAILFNRTNAYWGSQSSAMLGSGVASLTSAALAIRFVRAGRAARAAGGA